MAKRFLITLIIMLVCIIVLVKVGDIIFARFYSFPQKVTYGVTFSPRYARYLNLDWQKTYLSILDDLKVKNLRLPSYWNSLEPQINDEDFSDTDFMLDEAQKRQVKVILVVGIRQPRWPECHIPSWAKSLTVKERQQAALKFIEKVVKRYQDKASIKAWQVENEPLLTVFGEGCDAYDKNFLKSELELVRQLDSRQIILTDSGELGIWVAPMRMSDILGISVYRTTYNSILGYQSYPLVPFLYNLKSTLVRKLFAQQNQKTIITELQAEPWLSRAVEGEDTFQRQRQIFSEENFKANVDYARRIGFGEIYLWGVEWWYFMKDAGFPQYLEYAKELF